jgi:hypothetical protein
MKRTLWYVCKRPFELPQRMRCHREAVGLLQVFEYRPKSKRYSYGLRMEAQVHTEEEARAAHSQALQLAENLDMVWPYVAGARLFPHALRLESRDSPEGWESNFSRVAKTLPTTQALQISRIRFGGRYMVPLPLMPLQAALSAVRRLQAASDATRVLIQLHTRAMDNPGTEVGLFLIAKALELVRTMLPGRDDRARQAGLSADGLGELRQSLHWLL